MSRDFIRAGIWANRSGFGERDLDAEYAARNLTAVLGQGAQPECCWPMTSFRTSQKLSRPFVVS